MVSEPDLVNLIYQSKRYHYIISNWSTFFIIYYDYDRHSIPLTPLHPYTLNLKNEKRKKKKKRGAGLIQTSCFQIPFSFVNHHRLRFTFKPKQLNNNNQIFAMAMAIKLSLVLIFFFFFLSSLIPPTFSLYEDQVGFMDWYHSHSLFLLFLLFNSTHSIFDWCNTIA